MNNRWEWASTSGIEYITMLNWTDRGAHLSFSSRGGGVSNGPYKSLNLSFQVGDKPDDVLTNRMILMDAISGDLHNTICCEQANGSQVAVVGITDRGRGSVQYADSIPGCDAMITNIKEVVLMCLVADCVPVYFFDPIKRVIGLAHFGYNPNYGNVAWETAKKMSQVFGCNYWDIEVFIGPGIGHCCNKIDEEKAQHLRDTYPLLKNNINNNKKRVYWDMASTISQTLEILGISPDNISTCDLCTRCSTDRFFSTDRKSVTGRMAAVLSLTK